MCNLGTGSVTTVIKEAQRQISSKGLIRNSAASQGNNSSRSSSRHSYPGTITSPPRGTRVFNNWPSEAKIEGEPPQGHHTAISPVRLEAIQLGGFNVRYSENKASLSTDTQSELSPWKPQGQRENKWLPVAELSWYATSGNAQQDKLITGLLGSNRAKEASPCLVNNTSQYSVGEVKYYLSSQHQIG